MPPYLTDPKLLVTGYRPCLALGLAGLVAAKVALVVALAVVRSVVVVDAVVDLVVVEETVMVEVNDVGSSRPIIVPQTALESLISSPALANNEHRPSAELKKKHLESLLHMLQQSDVFVIWIVLISSPPSIRIPIVYVHR